MAVMDVDDDDSARAFEKLQSVEGTMRVRVLY